MKMLKKIAAAIMAVAMATLMLTACGEDSAPSFGKQVEDATIKTFNAAIGENSALTNDSALRAQAAQLLENVDADGKIEAQKSFKLPKDMGYGKEYTIVVATKDLGKILYNRNPDDKVEPNDKVDAIKVTAEELAKLQNPQANGLADVIGQYNAEIIAVGVATKTINGNTYMAVAMTYKYKVNQPAL